MIRKPKIHPVYGISLVGIPFSERWDVVQYASEIELNNFIKNYKHIKGYFAKMHHDGTDFNWRDYRASVVNEKAENIYYRKLWRVRYSKAFDTTKLYTIDKTKMYRWDIKLSSKNGIGLTSSWAYSVNGKYPVRTKLVKGDCLLYSHTDELGNVFFIRADDVGAPHMFGFNKENKQLQFIVEVES